LDDAIIDTVADAFKAMRIADGIAHNTRRQPLRPADLDRAVELHQRLETAYWELFGLIALTDPPAGGVPSRQPTE
jgi:hypothetical protein